MAANTHDHPYFHDYGNVDHSKTRVEFHSDGRCVTTVEQVMGAPFKPAAMRQYVNAANWGKAYTDQNTPVSAQGDAVVYQSADFSTIVPQSTTCTCPAPHHPSARFCPRCGGTIRRPSNLIHLLTATIGIVAVVLVVIGILRESGTQYAAGMFLGITSLLAIILTPTKK